MENTLDNETENPYKAPEAEVVNRTDQGGLSHVFERFSTWGVIGLAIVTLGLYSIYWLYSRTGQLNKHANNPIGAAFINITIGLCVIGFVNNLSYVLNFNATVAAILALSSVIGTILTIVWVFKIRNRINLLLNSAKGDASRLGPVFTFFLNIYYLQYKINSIIDRE